MLTKTKAKIMLVLVSASASLSTLLSPAAHAEYASAGEQGAIRSVWQARIDAHRQSDPEMAKLEESLMTAKLNCDPAYSRLFGQYLELKSRRNPNNAQRIYRCMPYLVRLEEQEGIRNEIAHGKQAELIQKRRQLDEASKQLASQLPRRRR